VTLNEARQILIASQPQRDDREDPLLQQALALVEKEPALGQWLERQRSFHDAASRSLRSIPVPVTLRNQVLASRKIVRPAQWWRHPLLWSAAALFLLFAGVNHWRSDAPPEDSLRTFRSRMVGAVLRQYTMDIVTNDMTQVRSFLATRNAPADYSLPDKLRRLPVSGAGVLSWQGQKVSMVCLDSAQHGTLFLFVVDRASLSEGPSAARDFQPVSKLATVSWATGSQVYVLAGSGGREALEQYF